MVRFFALTFACLLAAACDRMGSARSPLQPIADAPIVSRTVDEHGLTHSIDANGIERLGIDFEPRLETANTTR